MSEPRASRPTAPDWLGGESLLPWSWADEHLAKERNYWLVSVRRNGFPQARPLWGVWSDGLLYLSVGHAGLQRAEEPEEGRLDVSVHVDSAVDVVIVEGTIERVADEYGGGRFKIPGGVDDEALHRAGELYKAKYDYSADFVNFVVRPRVVYGWRAEDVRTATKWTFA